MTRTHKNIEQEIVNLCNLLIWLWKWLSSVGGKVQREDRAGRSSEVNNLVSSKSSSQRILSWNQLSPVHSSRWWHWQDSNMKKRLSFGKSNIYYKTARLWYIRIINNSKIQKEKKSQTKSHLDLGVPSDIFRPLWMSSSDWWDIIVMKFEIWK